MPEGPEMVFLKEQAEQFIGEEVVNAAGDTPNINFSAIKGQVLTQIKTYGKEILFIFSDCTLRIHLMLFGKYAINQEINRPLRLGLTFKTGEVNFYACSCRLLLEPIAALYDWQTDVMQDFFNAEKALEKLKLRSKEIISDGLLDQNIMAGVGNGIRNEVLYKTQIHPESLVSEIPERKLKKLIGACVKLSFEYLDWLREGTANEHWQVYQQKVCPRDHIALQKEKIGKTNRTAYFCDKCQQLYIPDHD